jgi:hypothetical protein
MVAPVVRPCGFGTDGHCLPAIRTPMPETTSCSSASPRSLAARVSLVGDTKSLLRGPPIQQNSDPEIRTASVVPPNDFVVELPADSAEPAHAAGDGHRS